MLGPPVAKATNITCTGASHMDKKPMMVLGTVGSSHQAVAMMCRHEYMNNFGDMARLEFGSRHNLEHCPSSIAVDVHTKRALSSHSLCSLIANHLHLKIFLGMVAIAETSTYLGNIDFKKLITVRYSHSDFKTDLKRELLEHAQQEGKGWEEKPGPVTRGAVEDVAGRGRAAQLKQFATSLHRHCQTFKDSHNKKCMVYVDNDERLFLWQGLLLSANEFHALDMACEGHERHGRNGPFICATAQMNAIA
jgi:hypothetical protein